VKENSQIRTEKPGRRRRKQTIKPAVWMAVTVSQLFRNY
jgi:hypothetical protein